MTIKTGVVKRLAKEKVTYEKEAQTNRDRIAKFKAVGYLYVAAGWVVNINRIYFIAGWQRYPCDPERGGMPAGIIDDGPGLPAEVIVTRQMTQIRRFLILRPEESVLFLQNSFSNLPGYVIF